MTVTTYGIWISFMPHRPVRQNTLAVRIVSELAIGIYPCLAASLATDMIVNGRGQAYANLLFCGERFVVHRNRRRQPAYPWRHNLHMLCVDGNRDGGTREIAISSLGSVFLNRRFYYLDTPVPIS